MSKDGMLPEGVDENDSSAPWNEKTKEVSITVILTLDCTVPEDQSERELTREVYDQLQRALHDTDFGIEEIIIEED